ncbi:MAG: D-lyxose/D-mannose family sugar isomerase [Chloroflexota bacterium]
MITRRERDEAIAYAWELCQRTGLPLRPEERAKIEVADMGLSELQQSGLMILTLLATQEIAVKLIALYPWQACPQHRHPRVGDYPGKEEIFRGLWGECYAYVPGEPTPNPRARPPEHRRPYYTVWHEVGLAPGVQHYSPTNDWHWFQAGPQGAVIWSFSSRPSDYEDDFTDPAVRRRTVVVD